MPARISVLFVSFDQGKRWVRIDDVPPVRVDDLQIHPRTNDLVIATHGRSIAILDDTRAVARAHARDRSQAGASLQCRRR